jgi:hypothetical protein
MSDRREVLDRVIEAAWKDQAFKTLLLADPKAALKQINVPVPDGITVEVHEDTGKTFHLVIPRDPAVSELSDDELEAVAGGGGMDSWGTSMCS